MERLLTQQIDGKALYIIDPSCSMLIKGFAHGYRYKKKKDGQVEEKPDKNEYSHIHDANQYADSVIDIAVRGVQPRSNRRNIVKSKFVYA